jgi:hypothetical protein
MKIVTNSKLIARNSKIGKYASLVSLGILGVGLYISFTKPDKFIYSLAALALGFILSQVGMYYGNRWGRSPRPDEVIDKGLKGLSREFIIYHYVTPVSHLLVGPAGVWIIHPFHQSGSIVYEKGKWKSKGGGFLQSYLRLFGQENMGRPEVESRAAIDSTNRFLTNILPEGTTIPPIRSLLLFTSPKAEINVTEAPLPAISPKEMKDFFKNESKADQISMNQIELIQKALPKAEKEE